MTDMTKITLLNHFIKKYTEKAATANYKLVFIYEKILFVMDATDADLAYTAKLDKQSSSHGGQITLRFSPDKKVKKAMLARATVLCSQEFFENELTKWRAETGKRYNKGELVERLITEKAGQQWEKDNKPFWECGDVVINGIDYQIKFQGATFCTENQIMN